MVPARTSQFNKVFLREWFGTGRGERWKVVGDRRNRSFSYQGREDRESYERQYVLRSGGGEEAWTDLILLCRALNRTEAEHLPERLKSILNLDRALWFLALDNVLINSDGYIFSPTSDYDLYQDRGGRFHLCAIERRTGPLLGVVG